MSEWKAKRFWKETMVEAKEAGFEVLLDGRSVRTPLKSAMILPTEEMAQAVAREWDAQEGEIKPLTMPVTRAANAALDKVTLQHDEVAGMLAGYAETDLLCHRADHPVELRALQDAGWDPVMAWAEKTYAAPLTVVSGILPAEQPQNSLAIYRKVVSGYRPFGLTALHDLISISGSLLLGLWVAEGPGEAESAWDLSRIDEDWQISQWGDDDEALETAAKKRESFLFASRFLQMAGRA